MSYRCTNLESNYLDEKDILLLYRYEMTNDIYPSVYLIKFIVTKITPKGYWFTNEIGDLKWVNNNAMKSYAYDTKKSAMINFIKRKTKYIKILSSKIDRTNHAIIVAKKIQEELE